jgi:YVTN family beta-propeller protein
MRTVATIVLGSSLLLATAARAERYVYVLNDADDTVTAIDADAGTVAATIPVPGDPKALTVHPDGRTVYVVCQGSNELVTIDVPTHQERQRILIPTGLDPRGIAIDPAGDFVYVAFAFSDIAMQIPTLTLDMNQAVVMAVGHTGGRHVAVDPAGDRVYVITDDNSPQGGHLVWFDVDASGAVVGRDERADLFPFPADLSVSFSRRVLVTSIRGNLPQALYSVDTTTATGIVLPITSTGEPTGIAVYDSFGFPQIFVTRKDDDELANPFSFEVHATGDQPVAATYSDDESDTDDREALVTADFGADSTTFVYGDGTSLHVPVGDRPIDIAAGAVLRPRFQWQPLRLDWTYLQLDVRLIRRLKIGNAGTGNLVLGPSIIEGAGAARFAIYKNGCPARIAPGASCWIDVAFTPSRKDGYVSHTATLQVPSNDREAPVARIPLTGRYGK